MSSNNSNHFNESTKQNSLTSIDECTAMVLESENHNEIRLTVEALAIHNADLNRKYKSNASYTSSSTEDTVDKLDKIGQDLFLLEQALKTNNNKIASDILSQGKQNENANEKLKKENASLKKENANLKVVIVTLRRQIEILTKEQQNKNKHDAQSKSYISYINQMKREYGDNNSNMVSALR